MIDKFKLIEKQWSREKLPVQESTASRANPIKTVPSSVNYTPLVVVPTQLRNHPPSFSGKFARALHDEEDERRRRPTLNLAAARGVHQQLLVVCKGTPSIGIQQSIESITHLPMVLGVEPKYWIEGAMIKLSYNKVWKPHV